MGGIYGEGGEGRPTHPMSLLLNLWEVDPHLVKEAERGARHGEPLKRNRELTV